MADPVELGEDPIAGQVLAGAGDEGAVQFEGWFAPVPGSDLAAPERFRLYTDSQFMEWLEIPAAAVVARLVGTQHAEGKSIIWVKRQASIIRCCAGRAFEFGILEAGTTIDDPAAHRPRP